MIDVKTGLIFWSVESLALSAILLFAWLHDRGARAYILWSAAFTAHAVGVLLVAARGQIPDFLSIEIGNALALASYSFGVSGIRSIDGRAIRPIVALPTAIWIAGMFVPVIRENLGYRVSLYSIASASGCLLLMLSLLPPGIGTPRTRHSLASVFALQGAISVIASIEMSLRPALTLQEISTAPLTGFTAALSVVLSVMFGAKMLIERSEQRLRDLAAADMLTGVLNRRGFFDRFTSIKAEAERGNRQLALLLFDLDHFKQINDRHGHQAGDEVLIAFSRLVTRRLAGRGAFGRLGGEEFAAVMPIDDVAEAKQLAENIRAEFDASPVPCIGGGVSATVSTGLMSCDAQDATIDRMIRDADKALYGAKNAGRNRVVLASGAAPDMGEPPMDTDAQVAALQRAATTANNTKVSRRRTRSSLTGR